MYSQQRTAILLDHDQNSMNLPYKHTWKQVTLPNDFQNQLGVVRGDALIIRPHMLSKTAACVVVGNGPAKDMGNDIVRVDADTRRIIKSSIGQAVLVEKIDVIPAEEIKIEWFISSMVKKYIEPSTSQKITDTLRDFIFVELADLPLMIADRFKTVLTLPDNPEHSFNVTYWLRKIKPGFPVVKLVPSTQLIVY